MLQRKLLESSILLLGCGKMGSALLAGWLTSGIKLKNIYVIEPNPSSWLRSLEIKGLNLNTAAPKNPTFCVVAVKPQKLSSLTVLIENVNNSNTIFVSILAGTKIKTLEQFFVSEATVFRVMPNTPALVGEGVSAIIGNILASKDEYLMVRSLFEVVGKVLVLEDENLMDIVTAVSGSGPAYVFYLVEIIIKIAKMKGLSESVAHDLSISTLSGALALLQQSEEPFHKLRENVTSPGGTTAAAMNILTDEKSGLCQLFEKAIEAAVDRSIELGSQA